MKSPKRIVVAMGRFSPPTIGHQRMIERVRKESEALNCASIVVVSKAHDVESDPLDPSTKMSYLRKMWPDINFELTTDALPSIGHYLNGLGAVFDEVVFVCGSDRVSTFTQMFTRSNDKHFHFKKWRVECCGNRDDSGVIESISGTKMREAARFGDLREFIKGLPTNCSAMLGLLMFEDIRAAINMDKILGEKSIAKKEPTQG